MLLKWQRRSGASARSDDRLRRLVTTHIRGLLVLAALFAYLKVAQGEGSASARPRGAGSAMGCCSWPASMTSIRALG